MTMIYKFENLQKKLDEWGFPSLIGVSGFQIIKGIDFEKAYKSGSITFEEDGIYLEFEGKKYRDICSLRSLIFQDMAHIQNFI